MKKTQNTGVQTHPLQYRADDRGWLLKILMRHQLGENREFGEIYVTAAHPGQVKGNHYHQFSTEWFCVIQGRARLVTRNLQTGEATEIVLSEDAPATVEVAPHIAHAVQNIGQDLMLLLAYADQPYDSAHPDEVPVTVISPDQP